MSGDELLLTARDLIMKIHVITGWVIPENEYSIILTDQFTKLLHEKYARATSYEFEFAFRNISNEVRDWGKRINFSLIDEVMQPYLERRFELSKLEESHNQKLLSDTTKSEPLTDEVMNNWWEDVEKKVKKGEISFEFVPVMLYEWKEKNGGTATGKQKNLIMIAMRDHLEEQLLKDKSQAGVQAYEKFMKMKETGTFTGDVAARIIQLSKRKIVFEMMKL